MLREDLRLMKKARCNTFSVGIFSWSALEPKEGEYDFSFLDETIENIGKIGAKVNLATPSAAMPYHLAAKYPEVLKVTKNGERKKFGGQTEFLPHFADLSRESARNQRKVIRAVRAERNRSYVAYIQ